MFGGKASLVQQERNGALNLTLLNGTARLTVVFNTPLAGLWSLETAMFAWGTIAGGGNETR